MQLADHLAEPPKPAEKEIRVITPNGWQRVYPAIFDAKGIPQSCPVAKPGEF